MTSMLMLRRPQHDWPVIVAFSNGPALPPARHWPDREDVVGFMLPPTGVSELAVNGVGLLAAMVAAFPREQRREANELVLDALDFADAADAADSFGHLDATAYPPFMLVIADNRDAFMLSNWSKGPRVSVDAIQPGLMKLDSTLEPPDLTPDPATEGWTEWRAMLDRHGAQARSMIALPSIDRHGEPVLWDFATDGAWRNIVV